MSDDAVYQQQQEVSRLMGRCILRLQQYEVQIKAIMANHVFSITVKNFEESRVTSASRYATNTLGGLVNAFLGTVVGVGEREASEDKSAAHPDDVSSLTMRFGFSLQQEDYDDIATGMRDLVQLRNGLVHNFIEQHDLWTLEGCQRAQQQLVIDGDRIGKHLERLREFATEMDRMLREFGALLRQV